MASRFAVGLCGLVLVCGMHFRSGDPPPRPAASPVVMTPGVWHSIAVADNRAKFTLSGKDHQRCVLVVSSLGDAAQSYRVRLRAEPIEVVATSECHSPSPLEGGCGGEGTGWSPAFRRPAEAGTPTRRADPSPPTPLPQGEREDRTSRRAFDIHVGPGPINDAAAYERITGEVVSESDSVRVFLDQQQVIDEATRDVANDILRLLETQIIPRSRELLGTHADVDGDGKLAVLVTPVLDRVSARGSIGGFVRASDFRRDASPPFGSRADVIYLNSKVVSPGEHLHALLAHEYTHAVCFSEHWRRETAGERVCDEEDWLTEAIAHVAEQRHHAGWSNLDYRIARYLRDPASAPLVVPDAARAGLWRDPGCRGASYLFLQWCVDQCGDDFLRDLIHSPRRGRANIEHAAGVPFTELFRRWTIAMWDAGRSESDDVARSVGYRSTSLHGRLGEQVLSGPTSSAWQMDGALDLQLRGTATAFIELLAPADGRSRRITLTADSGTELQLTLIPLAVEDSSPMLVAETPAPPR